MFDNDALSRLRRRFIGIGDPGVEAGAHIPPINPKVIRRETEEAKKADTAPKPKENESGK